MRRVLLSLACVAFVACKSETPAEPRARGTRSAPSTSSAPSAVASVSSSAHAAASASGAPPPAVVTARYAAAPRVVAIGDVHGDLTATLAALELAGAVDADKKWVGGELVLVQTGDQLDRGDDEPEIVKLFDDLATQAGAAGGAVHALNGNHETMNVGADFRYVTPEGFSDFSDVRAPAAMTEMLTRVPAPARGRAAAFLPGGEYARRLAERDVVAIVGRTVFVHGGVLEAHVRYGIDRLNRETREWMAGARPTPPSILVHNNAPVWTRLYSEGEATNEACQELGRVLELLDVDRMVVSHTPQDRGINAACDDRVWRIDVGLAAHYAGAFIQVLEISGDVVKIKSVPRTAAVPSAASAR